MGSKGNKILWITVIVILLISIFPLIKFLEIYKKTADSYLCNKPLFIIQSDDWGMCGVRDQDTYDLLIEQGFALDEDPWGVYSMETEEDMHALYNMLLRHKDSAGNPPVFTCNFILTNPDFKAIQKSDFQSYAYLTLGDGLPGKWDRRNLLPVYLAGIRKGVIYPGYHGREHFNADTWLKLLREKDRAAHALFNEDMTFGYRGMAPALKGDGLGVTIDEDSLSRVIQSQKVWEFNR